jgi:uncharacterized OB-fold protein
VRPTPRTDSHIRPTEGGLLLVATRTARHPQLQFPPAQFVHCDEAVEEVTLGPLGRLYTYTVVHTGKDAKPYALAAVDFEPGVRAFGRLVIADGQPPRIDGTVRVVPFELPDGSADYAFEAVTGEAP